MKSISFVVIIALALIGIGSSCKNDLDLNGNIVPKLAVYGLLDYGDTAHYLKIYKTFLTEESVYTAAQNMDNYLMYDTLEVSLIEVKNGVYQRTLQFDTTTEVPKDPGIFTNPQKPTKQVLYVNRAVLDPEARYYLEIKNKYTGALLASCDGIDLVHPSSYGTSLYNTNPLNLTQSSSVDFTLEKSTLRMYMPMTGSYRYEAYYNFYYWEKTSEAAMDSLLKGPIKIGIGTISHSGTGIVGIEWRPKAFYSVLMASIPKLDNGNFTIRRTGPVHLEVWGAGADYASYIENAGQSSSSIVENRPITTNITNGVGLMSSRYRVKYTNYRLNANSINKLLESTYYQLHFRN